MGTTEKQVGGGAATPFSEEFINQFLFPILFGQGAGPPGAPAKGGMFGGGALAKKFGRGTPADKFAQSRPFDMTSGIAGQLMKLVQGRDIAGEKGSLASVIESDIQTGVADLRERFTAAGGGGLGTPGAVAESKFRAEAVPRKALAIGQLEQQNIMQQLAAILPLLQIMSGISGMGIPQAGIISQPDWASKMFQGGVDIASAFAGGG